MAADELHYQNPALVDHATASAVLRAALNGAADEPAAATVLIGLALHDDDAEFVERWCVDLGRQARAGSPLLGLAALCIGHLARRFGGVSDDAAALVASLAARAARDPGDVDARALDGLDDVETFAARR